MVLAILVMLVVVFLTIKGFSEPFMALLAFMTMYVTQPGELLPMLGYLHLERVLLLLVVLSSVMNQKRLRFPPLTKAFLGFYGAMIVAIPLAFWPGNSFLACRAFFEVVLLHMLIVSLLLTETQIKTFLVVSVCLTAWLGGSATYMYHIGVRQFTMGIDRAEGLTSSGGDPNTLGITIVVAMPLCMLLMSKGNSMRLRILGLAAAGIGLLTIVTTGSRTAFLAFLLFLVLLLLQQKKNLKFLPLIVLAAPLFWYVIPDQYKARYQSVSTRNSDESYTNRILSWQGGIQMFLHNPITGVGPDNYTVANGNKYWPGFPRHWLNAHSLYFKVLGELGLVGVFAFGGYLIVLIRLNRSLSRRFQQQKCSVILSKYPAYCNLSLYLLLFTGYSAHNLYRSTWFILGAISGALSLLPQGNEEAAAIESTTKKQPAWIPQAEALPSDGTVAVEREASLTAPSR